jgi:hypothetical protein
MGSSWGNSRVGFRLVSSLVFRLIFGPGSRLVFDLIIFLIFGLGSRLVFGFIIFLIFGLGSRLIFRLTRCVSAASTAVVLASRDIFVTAIAPTTTS